MAVLLLVTMSLPGPARAQSDTEEASVAVAAIVACVLVLGSLLHDGSQGEQPAVEPQQRPDVPAPVAEPTPAPLVAPVAVMLTPALESPRHAAERADGPRHDLIEMQSRNQHTRPPTRRRGYVPPASEWPHWVQR